MQPSSNGKTSKLMKNLLSVTGLVLFSKALGFVKQMIRANLFGATLETDMLALSEGVIHNVDYILAQTLVTAFVPVYHYVKTESEDKAAQFVSNSLKFFFLVGCAGAFLMEIFAVPLSELLAPSYTAEMTAILASYVRIFAPGLTLILLNAYFSALLKANERFVLGEISSLNQSLSLIIVMLLLWRVFGVSTLIIGFYVYVGSNLALLLMSSKPYWRLLPSGRLFQDPYLKRLFRMAGAPFIGYSMVFINQLVDKILVSGLESGSLTSMGYAAVLSNFIGAIIGSFCSVLYTYMSQSAAAKDTKSVTEIALHNLTLLITLLLPVSILTILHARDIVAIVFGRGAFNEEAVLITSRALTGYAFMFAPLAVRELFSRLFFCYQDSRRPTVNSMIGIALNIVLSIALCPRFGVLGVTIATSVSVLISALLNLTTFCRHYSFLNLSPLLRYVPLWGIGGVACVILSGFVAVWFPGFSPLPRFILTCLLAGGGYLLIVFPALRYYVQWRQRE